MTKKITFQSTNHGKLPIDHNGFYGQFGGCFVPERLKPNLIELEEAFYNALADHTFISQYIRLLKEYSGRPTPLYRAEILSRLYGTNIYLKREDLNHTGAHKINNAIGMALLAKRMGKKRIIAETGAGQHGVATATVCALTGLDCTVYMGATDVERQRSNVERMTMLGAEVVSVISGNGTLQDAVEAAMTEWMNRKDDTFYMIGSAVGPHPFPEIVARFQSVISKEICDQIYPLTGKQAPDYVIACVGDESNASGAFYHYLDNQNVKLIAVEAAGQVIESGKHALSICTGKETILHGARTLSITDSQGNVTEPYSISAGLDYPGVGPLIAYLASEKRIQCLWATDNEAVEAAFLLARTEGIIPAMESSHALAALSKMNFMSDDIVRCLSIGTWGQRSGYFSLLQPQTRHHYCQIKFFD